MRRLAAPLLATSFALTSAVLAAAPAGAHVELIESEPADGGEVTEGQTTVSMTMAAFDPDAPVEVEVTDPAGIDVTAGGPEVDARASTIEIATDPLEPGQHIVHWHATADDGDGESEGTFRFTVTEAPGGGIGIWVLWIVALAIPAAIFLRPGARKPKP
ncbi:MAG TPA: copper resistance protein CopC [Acidimicrobiales bacterium]|nr:copper resistance protein CopC [Acidimicrobiales bacterium]